jgi:hypothetical protein
LRFLLVAAVAIGCGSDATAPQLRGFVYSAAAGACGPAGGPAVIVFLAPKPVVELDLSAPFVRVFVPVGASELTAHVWPVGTNTEAGGWFQPDASTPAIAGSGYMIVSSVDADKTIHGSLDLQFPDAGRITSEFHAKWLASNFYCI